MPTIAEIRTQYPQYSDMSDADLAGALHQKFYSDMPRPEFDAKIGFKAAPAPSSSVGDFFKSIPRGLYKGATGAPSSSMVPMADVEFSERPEKAEASEAFLKTIPKPEGRSGRFGEAVGETLGNPISYLGPGTLALKVGAGVTSAVGGEAARQAAEGTAFEKPAQVAGSVVGGVTGAKTFGPGAPKAAIPTSSELFTAGGTGYKAARESGFAVDPKSFGASYATKTGQELAGPDHGFSGGPRGVAPKTFSVLEELQNPPDGAVITASNLDTIRKNLGRIAEETQPANGGFAKPTPDAAAATIALERLRDYVENVPQSHVVAGNAEDYVRSIKQANADWAAGSRVRNLDARLTKAENTTDRQIAGSLDAQIKSKAGSMLDTPERMRGMNQAEKDQLQLINSGGPVSNTLRQLGRGGAGVIPIMGQLAAAPFVAGAAGPAGLIAQALLAGGLYGARKGSEAITKSRAETLVEMLAKRSPEYEKRAAALPPADVSPNVAAVVRALMQGGN